MAFQIGYYDSAGDRSAPSALTVGGFLAPARNWAKLSRDWQTALELEGVTVFHMTDCLAGRGEFTGWDRQPTRQVRLLRTLTKIIRRYVHFGVASSVVLDDWRSLNEQRAMKECHVTPYGLAAFSALGKSILWVGRNRPRDPLKAVFERGDADRGDREHLLSWMRTLAKGRLDSVETREDPKEAPPLQAADLAAWEHRFAVGGVVTQTLVDLREPLAELLKIDSSYGVIMREALAEHCEKLGVPERSTWRAWSQRERAKWRPASFRKGTLYPATPGG